ncbi:MAG: DNA polymerase I [Rickettsiales bacterium]|nr:DNA polymerase I [Rickettsiales bacterium]
MQKVILIDGYGFVFRAYHSLPPLKNPQGVYVGAVFGFANMLHRMIKKYPDDKIIILLDAGQKTFRHDIYKEYKANRPPAPEDLKPQFPLIRDTAEAFNLTTIEKDGYEADDLIAALSYEAEAMNHEVTIISSDKDLMQLIRKNVNMFDPMKNKTIGSEQVYEKFGVMPNQICDYLSLLGDSSDNIPGVKGIGAKTAATLLNTFNNLDNIYNSIDQIEKPRIQKLLNEGKENAYLSKELIDLTKPRFQNFNLDSIKPHQFNEKALIEFLDFHGFIALKSKISANFSDAVNSNVQKVVKNNVKKELIEISENNIKELSSLTNLERIGLFHFHTKTAEFLFILSQDKDYFYHIKPDNNSSLFKDIDELLKKLKQQCLNFLNDKSLKIIISNLKEFLHFLALDLSISTNIESFSNVIDLDLVEYLLAIEENDKLISKRAALLKSDFIASDIAINLNINFNQTDHLFNDLVKQNHLDIYQKLDRKINNLLFNMEQNGISVSVDKLSALSNEFAREINDLTIKIYQIAGEEFNIASPKQLGEILFDKLALETKKKTAKAKNKSTSSDVLEDLKANGHEIASLILKWRHFAKLKSTYTEALPKSINKNTNRIHSIFNNCLTSTSRLSSSNPNLQNIPIRSAEGDLIRECFIAPKDSKFIGADYSQIELRLLAHIANVKSLKQAFADGKDIHRATAAEMFEIPVDQVSDEMRSHSKQINFGIIYGISAYGLAERLNIERKRAKDFIDKYFLKYPEIKIYMDTVLDNCRNNLFVETLIGRKLYFPNINTKNGMVRSFQERAAINAPLQGSASDIIKIAMINIDKELKKQKLNSKLILQVHDELIYEVPEAEKTICADIVKNGMENAFKLSVPLTVNLAIAENWHKLK